MTPCFINGCFCVFACVELLTLTNDIPYFEGLNIDTIGELLILERVKQMYRVVLETVVCRYVVAYLRLFANML